MRLGKATSLISTEIVAAFLFLSLLAVCLTGRPAHRPDFSFLTEQRQRGRRQQAFLFIGALSGRSYWQRRQACRDAWVAAANAEEQNSAATTRPVITRFFMAAEGAVDPEGEAETKAHSDDLVLIPGEFSYDNIGVLVLAMFEHALQHYEVSFIMKTDDDSFVNVPALLIYLQQSCERSDCSGERSYMGWEEGAEARHGVDHKFRHEDYYKQTGLEVYPPFMRGGGYILSAEAARLMLDVVRMSDTAMFNTPVEDAAVGFYMSALRLRRFHSTRWWATNPQQYNGMASTFPRDELARTSICGNASAPFVIHNQKDPTDMRFLGELFRKCSHYGSVVLNTGHDGM